MLATRITTAKYRARLGLLAVLLLSLAPWSVANSIYQCKNDSGQVSFQQRPCPGGDATQDLLTSRVSLQHAPSPAGLSSSEVMARNEMIARNIALDAKAKAWGISRAQLDRLDWLEEDRGIEGGDTIDNLNQAAKDSAEVLKLAGANSRAFTELEALRGKRVVEYVKFRSKQLIEIRTKEVESELSLMSNKDGQEDNLSESRQAKIAALADYRVRISTEALGYIKDELKKSLAAEHQLLKNLAEQERAIVIERERQAKVLAEFQ